MTGLAFLQLVLA